MHTKKIVLLGILILCLISLSGCLDTQTIEPYLSTINTDSLVGSWSFEEPIWNDIRNTTYDGSTIQNPGYITNATLASPGAIGRSCAYFNNASITINNDPNLEPQTLSIEIWIKAPSLPANQSLISKGAQGCYHSSYGISTTNHGLVFYITNNTITVTSPHSGTQIWDNQWHHITGTYDGSTLNLYVDGMQIQNGNNIQLTIQYNLSYTDLIIGNYLGNCIHPYTGYIDEVMIWNRALTQEEIYQHYLLGQQISYIQSSQINISYTELGKLMSNLLGGHKSTDVIIVKAQDLAIQDSLIFTTARTVLKDFQNIKVILDTDINDFSDITSQYKIVALLGGVQTNIYTSELFNDTRWEESSTHFAAPIFMKLGTHPDTERYIMIYYTTLETTNLENKAVEKSLLAGLMDKRMVPVVATVASISLLYLWSILSNILIEFFFDYSSEHAQDHKKAKHFRNLFSPKVQYTGNLASRREISGMFLAILVFAIALSWTWTEDLTTFLELFIINIIIITLIYALRESLRIHFSHKKKLHTEHIFWPFGAVITLGSTILGNTFSLASYTILQDEDDIKDYGHMYFRIFILMFIITWILFIINLYIPSVILQMLYVFVIMSVVIDMTPVNPMDGADVKKWNGKKWAFLYIIVIITYISINFANLLYL
jgi:hypothetical protein